MAKERQQQHVVGENERPFQERSHCLVIEHPQLLGNRERISLEPVRKLGRTVEVDTEGGKVLGGTTSKKIGSANPSTSLNSRVSSNLNGLG